MAAEIVVPQIDKRFNTVLIVKWHKKPGEYVRLGEPLVEVETAKACVEIEANCTGFFLKALKAERDVVPVGTVIGYIGTEGEEVCTEAP